MMADLLTYCELVSVASGWWVFLIERGISLTKAS